MLYIPSKEGHVVSARNSTVVRRWAAMLALSVSIWTSGAQASPAGELDPLFGDHGRIILRDPSFGELYGVNVFAQGGDKLLVVGSGYDINTVLRLNNDGSPDVTFGNQGQVRLDLGDESLQMSNVVLLADGRLLVSGVLDPYGDSAEVIHGRGMLARFNADGSPDTTFGQDGRAPFDLGGVWEAVSRILVQPDGRIVVLGATGDFYSPARVLAGYLANGLPDTGFGTGATPGVSFVELAENGLLVDLARQADGKLLACGFTSAAGSSTGGRLLVLRFNSNGSIDTSFGLGGGVTVGEWPEPVSVDNCQLLPDGHLLMAGTWHEDGVSRGVVFRLAPDGRLDTGFGNLGRAVLPTVEGSAASAMLLMSDGTLAVGGHSFDPSVDFVSEMLLARLDPVTGGIDQQFGNQGIITADFGARDFPGLAYVARITQQADGKLVLVGTQTDWYDWYPAFNLAMARIDPYGSGSNGWAGLASVSGTVAIGDTFNVRVRRTGGFTGELSVDYHTFDISAAAGSDYVAQSGTLTWPDGDSDVRTLSIATMASESTATSEIFGIQLTNSSGGLANDRMSISFIKGSSTPPPAGVPKAPVATQRTGGSGAIGIEVWLLVFLMACRRRREKPCPR